MCSFQLSSSISALQAQLADSARTVSCLPPLQPFPGSCYSARVGKNKGLPPLGAGARGVEAFHAYYRGIFGPRWEALAAALVSPADSLPFRAGEGCEPYFMDSASILAASSLELAPGGRVLDACAAPGGKTLVLASRLGPGSGLVANELSADRRRRLAAVLDRHLPPEARRRVEVLGRDAAAMCRSFEAAFDAVLLDAPCSSERHVLGQALAHQRAHEGAREAALEAWSPARVRSLALRQWSLLSSALIMLKAGGSLVYSTCALSPEENDRVVARAVARYGKALSFDWPDYRGPGEAEKTEYGLMILPDRTGGAGPIYLCRVRKA